MFGLEQIKAMNEEVSSLPVDPTPLPTVDDVREAVAKAIESFVDDPPKTDFTRGYLAALITIAKDDLQENVYAYPYSHGILALANSGIEETVGPCSKLPATHVARLEGKKLDVGVSV
jgi:hypothetical protein